MKKRYFILVCIAFILAEFVVFQKIHDISYNNGYNKGFDEGYNQGYNKCIEHNDIMEKLGICKYAEKICGKE